jgi:serine/threonine protein phosphatase PrpC
MSTTTTFKCAGETHPGRVRENNEDRFHLDPERGIFMVIDGVGGQAAGEKAAEIALGLMRGRLERQTGNVTDRIREAITVANNEIYRLGQTNVAWRGMACVVTVAIVEECQTTIGHVGDTRLYQILQGQIRKITHDQSPVGQREDQGQLSELEAMRHPRRNEVYRDVGSEEHAPDDEDFIEMIQIPFEPDGALLLCSDGLSDLVTSTRILRIVEQQAGDPWAIVKRLIEAANEAGGKDNITVLYVEGEQFAAGKGPVAQHPRVPVKTSRLLRPLWSRWALFLYGSLLGIVVSNYLQTHIWRNLQSGEAEQAGSPRPKIFVVSPGTGDGFATIEGALQEARPGDTVEVTPGQYHEQIYLKEGVSLISQKPREALIRLADEVMGPRIAVVGDGVKIGRFVGFKILGGEKNPLEIGLRLVNADVEIEDIEILGARTAGIEIEGAASALLRANYIHDNAGSGVVIRAPALPRLANNIIINNGRQVGKRKTGIEILEAARPVLIGNLIANNGIEGIRGYDAGSDKEYFHTNFFRFDGKATARYTSQPSKRTEGAADKTR